MKTSESRTKRILAISTLVVVVSGAVIGASLLATNISSQSTETAVAPTEVATASNAPTTTTPATGVLGEQITKEANYVVAVNKVAADGANTAIDVTVNNVSTMTLQFSPGLQFKLVGKTTGAAKQYQVPTGKKVFAGGPIAANQASNGILYFETFSGETAELRFYPDVEVPTDYIVVPLVPTN